jgi:hypothetical protein
MTAEERRSHPIGTVHSASERLDDVANHATVTVDTPGSVESNEESGRGWRHARGSGVDGVRVSPVGGGDEPDPSDRNQYHQSRSVRRSGLVR